MNKSTVLAFSYLSGDDSNRERISAAIPSSKEERERMRMLSQAYVTEQKLTPPLLLSELRQHAHALCSAASIDPAYIDFLLVLVNNAAWQDYLAGIPFTRRTLLLPPCLRSRETCPAEFDELGLLCEQCGRCDIGTLQEEAEQLGYAVLIAEGTSIVASVIERGMVDAVVGVSCLNSLEAAFSAMTSYAIPGIAIPLLRDGCDETDVDVDWVRQALRIASGRTHIPAPVITDIRKEVAGWFSRTELTAYLHPVHGETESISLDWLARGGKRWRPFLTVSTARALNGVETGSRAEVIRNVALAVECFHKASLAHDDIEDNDGMRYGKDTLHREYGMPLALNTGDLLVGEGYRLIACSGAPAADIARMLSVASDGHCRMCHGQGEELAWSHDPGILSVEQVLRIFRMKTSPAFEVALRLGAICAGADDTIHTALTAFSESLGIAYQIDDDLKDFHTEDTRDDIKAARPSLLLALLCENAPASLKQTLEAAWHNGTDPAVYADEIRQVAEMLGIEERARQLREKYRCKTLDALKDVKNINLKILLYRLTAKILGVES
jgi:geranylgeranyl pyrophosphate synthase